MEIGGIQVEAAYKTGTSKGWLIAYDSTDSKVTITPKDSIPTGAIAYPSNN